MKKIILDLDALHVKFSGKKDDRKKKVESFLRKIDLFEIYTPYSIIDLLSKWKDKRLALKIRNFYELNSKRILSAKEITDKLDELKLDEKVLIAALKKLDIKDEDILLVVVASIFSLDSIITFNRKHLINNQEKINEILNQFKISRVTIQEPS